MQRRHHRPESTREGASTRDATGPEGDRESAETRAGAKRDASLGMETTLVEREPPRLPAKEEQGGHHGFRER